YLGITVGRVSFNDHMPNEVRNAAGKITREAFPYINGLLKKKGLGQVVQYCYLRFGLETTVEMLDQIKEVGFTHATRAGISIRIDDLVIPGNKAAMVKKAEKEVVAVESQYMEGAITKGERYNKVIAIWSEVTEQVGREMFQALEDMDKKGTEFNPSFSM